MRNVGPVEEANGAGDRKNDANASGWKSLPEAGGASVSAADRFYEKLSKLNESSGLSLL